MSTLAQDACDSRGTANEEQVDVANFFARKSQHCLREASLPRGGS